MPTPEPRLPGVSTKEAAILLGTSESDVRRRIKAGTLPAESIPRPGGTLLRVLLDAAPEPHQPASDTRQPAPEPQQDTPAPRQEPPDFAEALSVALEPLREALALERAERQQLAQTAQELAARAAAAEARAELLAEENASLKARRWWRWW